jgi:7-cyano-7-deazaguanine synthase
VLLSGGIDSATALYLTKASNSVRAITFEYHGIARQEIRAAGEIATSAGVREHRYVRLPDLKEAEDIVGARFGRLPPTYIPLRNSIFYSFAASYAEEVRASLIVGGHNRDDERIFGDVGSAFFGNLERAFRSASPILRRNHIAISRPLREKSKPEVVELAVSLRVPLDLTWSCHRNGSQHCWHCDGCLGREKAFSVAGVSDPLALKRGGKLLKL